MTTEKLRAALDALCALARALPNVKHVRITQPQGMSRLIAVECVSDQHAIDLAQQFEIKCEALGSPESHYLRGRKDLGSITLCVEGPFHRHKPAKPISEMAEARFDAALATAQGLVDDVAGKGAP